MGTAVTQVSVSNTVFVTILEVDGIGIAPIPLQDTMVFSPNADGDFNLDDDRGVGVIWEGDLSMDVRGELDTLGITGDATKVLLSLDNTLFAMSEAGSVAFIAKKQLGGLAITVVVPEPSTAVLVGFGLVGLLLAASRRRKV